MVLTVLDSFNTVIPDPNYTCKKEIPQNLNINLLDAIAISGGFSRSAGKVKILSSNDTDPKFIMKIKDVLKLSPNLIPKINHKDKIIIGESFF